jgi:hypothetical protein
MTGSRSGIHRLSLLILLAMPLLADTQFTVRRMSRNDVPLGKGQCDIRLQVDNEVEVSVRGESVFIRTLSGRDARDDGSECNEPLPRDPRNFNYEVRDSRGEIVLIDQSSHNGVVVRIRDSKGGEGRYHFRLAWDIGGSSGGGGGRRFGDFDGRRGTSFSAAQAVDICRSAVQDKIISDYRFSRVDIRVARADDRPGRNDYIVGEAIGRRGGSAADFNFVCSVDFNSGRVRSVDVNRR